MRGDRNGNIPIRRLTRLDQKRLAGRVKKSRLVCDAKRIVSVIETYRFAHATFS